MSTSIYRTTVCPSCGNDAPIGNFCSNCGTRLMAKMVFRNKVACVGCGKEVVEGKFCFQCGSELAEPVPEQMDIDRLATLVKRDYFPFTEQEKNFLLYLLSKARRLNGEIICKALREDVCALLEVFDGSGEVLKNKLEGFYKHAVVTYRIPNVFGGFHWLSGLSVSKKMVEISLLPERLDELFEYVEEEKTLGIWPEEDTNETWN